MGATRPFTVNDFLAKKRRGEKITMLTAYDSLMSGIIDEAGIDSILIGDSLGMVVLGHGSTLPVTMEDMIAHSRAVRRGAPDAFLVADMPFGSYHAGVEEAVRNACRLVKEAGVNAVKLEGCEGVLDKVKSIVSSACVPVMGHIGLTPQSINTIGGYRVQGREKTTAARLLEDASRLEEAGCFAVVLECLPRKLAGKITSRVGIPTIGIGAGAECDGQVLVTHDMLGYNIKGVPGFVKRYGRLAEAVAEAVRSYKEEVLSGGYPDEAHSYD